jgi:hypothetical protein
MYFYMEGSNGAWEGTNPKIKWAPNGLNLIKGCQPPAGRSERLSVNSGRLLRNRSVFLDSFESRLQDLSNKYPYAPKQPPKLRDMAETI